MTSLHTHAFPTFPNHNFYFAFIYLVLVVFLSSSESGPISNFLLHVVLKALFPEFDLDFFLLRRIMNITISTEN